MPVIVLFISVGLFFKFSNFVFNFSCILTLCAFTLFLRFWIIFIIISLNLFSDTLPISASFGYSCTYLPCSFACSIFLCWLICLNFGVCGLLSMGCSIIIPLASDVCFLLGEVDPGACVAFLVPALSLVELDLVPLIGREVSNGVFWGGCELCMTLDSLSSDGWGSVPVLVVFWSEAF